VRDFAAVEGAKEVDAAAADRALRRLEVDAMGLDALDRRYMTLIAENFGGGPVGIETIAAALSEPRDAIEEIVEPFYRYLNRLEFEVTHGNDIRPRSTRV